VKQSHKKSQQATALTNQRMFEMDKPQSFEEVFKDAYDYWIDDADIHRYEGAKGLADQVWQHQQAKVEELQNYLYSIREWIDENKFEPTETWLTCSVLDVDEFLDVFCIGELSKKPKSCNHESNGVAMLSNPPVFKCRKCGENYKKQALKGEG
ncbi:hypothetical protein, partial [Acinetobacter baumannii]|uniref:hypothetical protein n=1 Tax=Acinetobacter baumannii TaxID=470 RepID=UPI003A878A0A